MQEVGGAHIAKLRRHLVDWKPVYVALHWDDLKGQLRLANLRARRDAPREITNSTRQKLRRLRVALAHEKRRDADFASASDGDAIQALAAQFDLLTLDHAAHAASLRRAIIVSQQQHTSARQRRNCDPIRRLHGGSDYSVFSACIRQIRASAIEEDGLVIPLPYRRTRWPKTGSRSCNNRRRHRGSKTHILPISLDGRHHRQTVHLPQSLRPKFARRLLSVHVGERMGQIASRTTGIVMK